MFSREHAWRSGLVVVLVIALAVRVALALVASHALWGDASDYQRHAVSIATGHGYPTSVLASPGTPSAFRPPAYPYLLGGLYALTGVSVTAGRLLSAVLGVLVVLLIAWLGREGWGPTVGLLAAAIAAIFLPLAALSSSLLSEPLFLVLELALALVLLALRRDPTRLRWAALAGALCSLAALTRSVGLLFLLPTLAVALAAPNWRLRGRAVLAAVCAAILVLTPWTIRNANTLHAFVPVSTQEGYTLAGEYNSRAGRHDDFQAIWQNPLVVPNIQASLGRLYRRPGGVNEAQLDSRLRSLALSYLDAHPGHLAATIWLTGLRLFGLGLNHAYTNTVGYQDIGLRYHLWLPTTLSAQVLAVIALLGLLAALTRVLELRLGPWWLWALPLLAVLASITTGGTPRYRAPLDPFLVILAALTLRAVYVRVTRGWRSQRAAASELSDASPLSV